MGAVYAITTVTFDRRPIFFDPKCASAVAIEISRCETEHRLQTEGWVVMPDHIHWIFVLKYGSLGAILQAFKSRTARRINAARPMGTVWQSGYYDHCLRNDDDLVKQTRYLVENPLRAGLAETLEDYPYWWCRWIRGSADSG